jgi:outer membrane biosynthesis protein TonB
MPPLAHTALAASIVLSALGAVVICLLTAMYGFTPPGEEPPDRATRRLFLTRVGHAVSAACFAGTAILLAVVLAQPARSTSPAAGDARVPGLASKLDAHMERLEGVERRMKDSEHTLERLEAEVSDVAAAQRIAAEPAPALVPAKGVERPRTAVAPKPIERPRATVAPVKPAPKAAEQSSVTVAPAPRPADRPTVTVTPPPRATGAAPAPPAAAAEPSADHSAASKDGEQPAASPAPPRVTPAPRSSRGVPPPPPADFRSKLRDDWRAIRRGWESAGDDFRSALERLRRGP